MITLLIAYPLNISDYLFIPIYHNFGGKHMNIKTNPLTKEEK